MPVSVTYTYLWTCQYLLGLGRQFLGTPAIWAEGFIHVISLSE